MTGNDRDFEIELGRSYSRGHESKPSPLRERSLRAFPYGSPESDRVPVFVAARVVQAIEQQAASNDKIEVGGVLLGTFCRCARESYVEVTDFIEASNAKSTGVSLTFTHETWEQITREQAARPDKAIVGWYHSHPGLGVFLSREDQFIHASYFTDPWQIAIVVDPADRNWGCFVQADGEMRQAAGFYIFADRKEARRVRDLTDRLWESSKRAQFAATAAGVSRSGKAVWAAIAVLVALQIVTGYLLLAGRTAPAKTPSYDTWAMQLLRACDLSGAEQMLRLRLIENPGDDSAARELQRLVAITESPGVENRTLDRVNFLLQRADEVARLGVEPIKEGSFENLIPDPGNSRLRLEAADPALESFRAYQAAAGSRQARLRRAVAVQRALATYGSPAWSRYAVEWLKQEKLREIAYGLHTGQSGYERALSKLSDSDRAIVNKVRASIGRAR